MKWDADKALTFQIVMLSGSEDRMRMAALNELLTAASGGDDFDLEVFIADSSTPSQWYGSASTAPFLSPRRTVVVRNILRKDPKEVQLQTLPQTGLLVLVADDEGGDADKQRRVDTWKKSWGNLVAKSGGTVIELSL